MVSCAARQPGMRLGEDILNYRYFHGYQILSSFDMSGFRSCAMLIFTDCYNEVISSVFRTIEIPKYPESASITLPGSIH